MTKVWDQLVIWLGSIPSSVWWVGIICGLGMGFMMLVAILTMNVVAGTWHVVHRPMWDEIDE